MDPSTFDGAAFDGAAFDGAGDAGTVGAAGLDVSTPGATFDGFAFDGAAFDGEPAADLPSLLPADLLEAAVAFLVARDELAEAFGRDDWLWGDEAAAGSDLPYCDLADFDFEAEYSTAGDDGLIPLDDDGECQLVVYAAGKAAARRLGDLVAKALHDAPLEFEGGTLLQLRRTRSGSEMDPDPGPGDCDVWARRIFFRAIVSRTL